MPRQTSNPTPKTACADSASEPLYVCEGAVQLDLFADWSPPASQKPAHAKPFVKWAGGKGQLLSQLEANLPSEIFGREFTCVEPFVGGGAMLFFMLQRFPNITRVLVNDINPTLAEAYRVVRNRPDALIDALATLERDYMALPDCNARKTYYLARRADFNRRNSDAVTQTALFIFLNRTCFNGLYRILHLPEILAAA